MNLTTPRNLLARVAVAGMPTSSTAALVASCPECGGGETASCGHLRCEDCGNIRTSHDIGGPLAVAPSQRVLTEDGVKRLIAAIREHNPDSAVTSAFEPGDPNSVRIADSGIHRDCIAAEHPLAQPLANAFAPQPESDRHSAQATIDEWQGNSGDYDSRGEWANAIWTGLIILGALFALAAFGYAVTALALIHGGSH